MTQRDQEDILFPEEIIPWDEVVRLVINLLIPFRHRAKGIECITGGFSSYKSVPDGLIQWLPFVLKDKQWEFIKEHLQDLPSLEFPVPLGIANEFIEKFIMLKDSPSIVPSFLTRASLIDDQRKRDSLFVPEKEELNRLVSEHDVFLVDASRKKCIGLAHGAYFTKREAIHYLEKKGLLDRAFAMGCSWGDQIREPEIGGLPPPIEDRYYGLPQELITMGIQEYRRTLTLRKYEVVASQLAQLHPKFGTEQVIEEDSGEIISSAPVSELDSIPVENGPNLAVDVVPLIQVSLPTTVGSNNVKSSSFKDPVVSERNEVKSMEENRATDSEITLVGESDPAATRLIGMKEVTDRLGVSRQTVYNYMNPDSPSYNPNFPLPRMLNEDNKWIESEFDAFVKSLTPPKKKRETKQNQ